jgi:hypothetical protein
MSYSSPIFDRYSDTQEKILFYLKTGADKGNHYFKSKYIARELGLSAKEVGINLAILSQTCDELEICKWSYSNSTTWRVIPRVG